MTEGDNSKLITRFIECTASLAFKMKTEKVIPAFDAAEFICLSLVESKSIQLEINRRIAEWKMMIFCDRNAPFEIVSQLYKNVNNLKCSDIRDDSDIEYYYAQYCIRQNKTMIARDILERLSSKLEQSKNDINLESLNRMKQLIKNLLLEIQENF